MNLKKFHYYRYYYFCQFLYYFIFSQILAEYLHSRCICKTPRHVISGRTRDRGIVGIFIAVISGDVDIRYLERNVRFGDVFTRYSRLKTKRYVTGHVGVLWCAPMLVEGNRNVSSSNCICIGILHPHGYTDGWSKHENCRKGLNLITIIR